MADWQVTYHTKVPALNNPLFIEGLPGIGNVGKIVVDYLVEEFKAKKLCSFFSHRFPHSVFINEDNLVEMPHIDVYYKKFGPKSKKRDLLLLSGDIQPIDEETTYSLCEEVLKIVKAHNCSEMITTGGIGLQQVPEHPKVYCTANDADLLKGYTLKKLKVQKNIFGVVGPIVGVSGVLLGLGSMRQVKGVALLAETFGHPLYVGIKGANELLRVIETKFSYGLNLKRISKEIGEMVEVEKELAMKTKEVVTEMIQAGAKGKKKDACYIG